jgi:quinol monooxygenase YgiN
MIVLKVDMLVKPGTEEKCREYLRLLQEHSRREPGCLMYSGHQSTEDPRKFLLYEQYEDRAALQSHRDSPHFRQYVTGGLDGIVEHRSRELFHSIE